MQMESLRWLSGINGRMSDLRSRGRGFNSRSGHYQVVTAWMGDCLRTGKPSRYITNKKTRSLSRLVLKRYQAVTHKPDGWTDKITIANTQVLRCQMLG